MTDEIELFMNGQKVELKNPGTKGLADFLKITRAMSKAPKDIESNQIMSYFDDDAINSIVRLINITLEKTFPTMNVEEREAWGMENAMLILPKVIEMCSPKQTRDEKKREELMSRI